MRLVDAVPRLRVNQRGDGTSIGQRPGLVIRMVRVRTPSVPLHLEYRVFPSSSVYPCPRMDPTGGSGEGAVSSDANTTIWLS